MGNESILKTIGRNFYVWFLTLSILIISMTLITIGVDENFLSLRITGGLALAPLAKPLWEIFKMKGDKQEQEYKLEIKKLKLQKEVLILDYKLNKLKLKLGK